jgi:hypothetical protein
MEKSFIIVGCILLHIVYIAILNIQLQSQLRVLLTYSFHSQHVSALSGHLQVNHDILYLYLVTKYIKLNIFIFSDHDVLFLYLVIMIYYIYI